MSDTVKRAAALLDRAKPGWENLIDTETLTFKGIGAMENCILGQLYSRYGKGMVVLRRLEGSEWLGRGLSAQVHPFYDRNGQGVTEWLVQIMNRRTMVSINTTEKVAA